MLIEDERISFWQPHERESMTRKKFYKIYKGVEQMPEERREGEKGEMLEAVLKFKSILQLDNKYVLC